MKTLIKILCLSVLWFSCENSTEPENIYGCTIPEACNFNPEATTFDDSCLELDDCGECGGNNENIIDECGNCEEQQIQYVELWGECYNIETTIEVIREFEGYSAPIPTDIGKLINLHTLSASGMNLYGTIPSEIGNLTNLIYLALDFNQLSGEIPPEIGNLTNLIHLNLYENQLTGEIPPEIGNLTNLSTLRLAYNQLTGVIPENFCNQGAAPNIDLVGNNQLCPPYPDCISQSDIDSQDTSNCP